jgi:hypothetical protein
MTNLKAGVKIELENPSYYLPAGFAIAASLDLG